MSNLSNTRYINCHIKTIYMLNCQTCQTLSTIGEQFGQRSANFDPICQLNSIQGSGEHVTARISCPGIVNCEM